MINRTKTLVVFNTWPAKTSDRKTSEECADAYALARGYCTVNGHYWKIGADFGGQSRGPGSSTQTAADFKMLLCNKSFAPGQTPEVDNPRYTGQPLIKAIANMVADGQLDAIFTESLVPNAPPQTGNQSPDGWIFSLAPLLATNKNYFGGSRGPVTDLFSDARQTLNNPDAGNWIANNRDTQLPYGRIGWPGCSFADIQRVAADANWGESQNNLTKKHVIGGTNYTGGGDTWHTNRANQYFVRRMGSANIGAFDQTAKYAGHPSPVGAGFLVDYVFFDWGAITPPLDLFGLLFSINPHYDASFQNVLSQKSWNPLRGAWAFDWCSGSAGVGYDCLRRGSAASILCEKEPYANGIPAVDCVAYALLLGLTMAEANFLSDLMLVSNHSVYGAPDYAPYMGKAVVIPPVDHRKGKAERRNRRVVQCRARSAAGSCSRRWNEGEAQVNIDALHAPSS